MNDASVSAQLEVLSSRGHRAGSVAQVLHMDQVIGTTSSPLWHPVSQWLMANARVRSVAVVPDGTVVADYLGIKSVLPVPDNVRGFITVYARSWWTFPCLTDPRDLIRSGEYVTTSGLVRLAEWAYGPAVDADEELSQIRNGYHRGKAECGCDRYAPGLWGHLSSRLAAVFAPVGTR